MSNRYRYPVPLAQMESGDLAEVLLARVIAEGDCLVYAGRISRAGYGELYSNSKYIGRVHRLVYEGVVGPIPDGLVLDHLCRNRACMNVGHLEPVTAVENTMRGMNRAAVNARKTECQFGHPFTEENTYLWRNTRRCRACRNPALRPSMAEQEPTP